MNSTYFDRLLVEVERRLQNKSRIFNSTIYPLVYDPLFSRFPCNTSVSSIIRAMFIEQWNISFAYDQYYQQCSPSACTYITTARARDCLGVLLTLISMIGGLSVGLRITTPILVNTVLDFLKPKTKQNSQKSNFPSRVKKVLQTLLKVVVDSNIFSAGAFGGQVERSTAKRLGQWSTRLYILLLAAALIILTLRAMISPETFTNTYPNPSLGTYTKLVTNHRSTLQCPCSRISSPYSRFLQIEARFHRVSRTLVSHFRQKLSSNRSVRALSCLINTDQSFSRM